jgi:hypothetical protein
MQQIMGADIPITTIIQIRFPLMDPRTTVKIVMSGQYHPTTAPGATLPMRYGLIEQIEY